jgi:predicted enzyme related to lactoylglutathione lyase
MADTLPQLAMHAVVLDCADPEPLVAFWSAALGYVRWFEPFGQFAGLKPPPDDPRRGLALIFQRVPEAKVVKNRAHVDYEAADRAAEVDRLVGLGASVVRVVDEGPEMRWTVMADPAGNEFCVTQQ